MGFAALAPVLLGGLGAGLSAYNTYRTAKRQDSAAADAIRSQGRIQQRADGKVNDEITKLEGSNSADEKAKREGQFLDALYKNKGRIEGGLNTQVGGEAFQKAQSDAKSGVEAYGAENAGLLARIDAPGMQRQGEAFGFGRLATDIGLLGRESSGQAFLDDLRMRSIRRNPWMDAGAGLLSGIGGAMGSDGGGGNPFGVPLPGSGVDMTKPTNYGSGSQGPWRWGGG
ncbi:MAG: hypothetical protein ACREER_12075 [Alphaproteobacteria bacterium]